MSDVGILSYEYEQASRLVSTLEALLERTDGGQGDRQERMEAARILRALLDLLDPIAAQGGDPDVAMNIPVGLVRRLRETRFEGEPYADALRELLDRLSDREHALADEDIRLLRNVAGATEQEAASVYRRLVRR